ncbi:beta-propeller fold lactonase family protein [Thalassotalea fusca]
MKIIKSLLAVCCCAILLVCNASFATEDLLELRYTISDSDKNIDGLDNPRMAKFSPDGSTLFVVSGDDNSLAIFDVHANDSLALKHIYKNKAFPQYRLEGASDVAVLNDGTKVLATSFYDGALSVFSKNKAGEYQFSQSISDNLSAERVFISKESIGKLDTLGLLGAWEVAKSSDGRQVFVASYMSNTIVLFKVTADGEVQFDRAITSDFSSDIDLGNPVSIVYSTAKSELIVAGFEKHKITVLSQLPSGKYVVKQQIENDKVGVKNLLNPQKMILSDDGSFLYVVSSGSNAIVAFKRINGQFEYLQSITNADIGSGLAGAGSLAISKEQQYLFAAGESDLGLLIFDIANDGQLSFNHKFTGDADNMLGGISSINLSSNSGKLVLTMAAKDTLHILALKEKKAP